MSDLYALLDALDQANGTKIDAVLATVVKVEGSAYRRPGARMLIPQFGQTVGTISGGCLEQDLTRKAWWLTECGGAVVRRYSTAAQEDEDAHADDLRRLPHCSRARRPVAQLQVLRAILMQPTQKQPWSLSRLLALVVLAGFAVVTLFPFYWMGITSFKPNEELLARDGNPFWVSSPTLAHFKKLLFDTAYPDWLWNTILISVVATALSLLPSLTENDTVRVEVSGLSETLR